MGSATLQWASAEWDQQHYSGRVLSGISNITVGECLVGSATLQWASAEWDQQHYSGRVLSGISNITVGEC